MANNTAAPVNKQKVSYIPFDSIHEGHTGSVKAMVCRSWDVNNINGRYMSTDYILSDDKGSVMHCIARANIAHCFIKKLLPGSVVTLNRFVVQRSKDEYRILKDGSFVIELQGSTTISKPQPVTEGYVRYPFELVEFEEVKPTERRHFIDVVGYVTSVGSLTNNSKGSKSLDFNLLNERGHSLRCTLWGKLGEDLLSRMGILCLSSSSGTLILDETAIPVLDTFKKSNGGLPVRESGLSFVGSDAKDGTLSELLDIGRSGSKEIVKIRCVVEIVTVCSKNSWYNFTCNGGRCRKGVSRRDGSFWCEACETPVSYPRARFKVQLDIKDATAEVVLACFDETVEVLTNTTAQALLNKDEDASFDESTLPSALTSLIGSTHTIEIRSNSYFHFGPYKSFNCAKVIPSSHSTSAPKPAIPETKDDLETPEKDNERLKRKEFEYEDSDADDPVNNSVISSLPTGRRTRRQIVHEDESQADEEAAEHAP